MNFISVNFPWVKPEYVLFALFLFLSLLSLLARRVVKRFLIRLALIDSKLTKGEKILISLSSWISY
ncbi:MAG: mechanosensitive ion channel family protein, partial [Thermovibrio sp.]